VSFQLSANLMLGVGVGKYDHLPTLRNAVGDVEKVGEWLANNGFTQTVIPDMKREEIVERLLEALPADSMRKEGTVLVVLWCGHATQNPNTGNLRLLGCSDRPDAPDLSAITAVQLAELAANSGAAQLLLIVDTCYSGSAVVDVAKVIDAVQAADINRTHRWMGVVASCQDYERAVDGVLAQKLLDLLENGPQQPELRVRWSSYQAGLRGDDLIDALVKEWGKDERQLPKSISAGDPWLVLPNPLFNPDAREQVVEHLLWAARGASPNEAGVWFVGRERYLREIVAWMRGGEPGLCVITGKAGCGKSAVAGRLVSLSNSDERALILEAQGQPLPDLDPGLGAIDAHVQVRGMTLERCSTILSRGLGVVAAGPVQTHYDLLAWASAQERPPAVVVDGLDEAGAEGHRIAGELLRPLSQHAQVVVASRELPGIDGESSLLGALGAPDLLADLDAHPEDTDRDVYEYVVQRLSKGTDNG